MSLTENRACISLMGSERVRRNLCVPRYTPPGWFECDVFEVTRPGFFCEYEVKLTLRDFKDDNQKRMAKRPHQWGTPEIWENKHDLLSRGDVRGPSQFWFVTPPGLVTHTDLPVWAGLIELDDRGECHRPSQRWTISELVKAPNLHRNKFDPKHRERAVGACYYRFHDLLRAAGDNIMVPTDWSDRLEHEHAVDQPMEVQFSEPFLPFSI